MTQCGVAVAPATCIAAEDPQHQPVLALDDPAVACLIAEVDDILCAAEALLRQPPAPPAVGCALLGRRRAGRCFELTARPWSGPARNVSAVQRSPPQRATYE